MSKFLQPSFTIGANDASASKSYRANYPFEDVWAKRWAEREARENAEAEAARTGKDEELEPRENAKDGE